MGKTLHYAVQLIPQDDGSFALTARDLPGLSASVPHDVDVASASLAAVIDEIKRLALDKTAIPQPTTIIDGEKFVSLPLDVSLYAELHNIDVELGKYGIEVSSFDPFWIDLDPRSHVSLTDHLRDTNAKMLEALKRHYATSQPQVQSESSASSHSPSLDAPTLAHVLQKIDSLDVTDLRAYCLAQFYEAGGTDQQLTSVATPGKGS